MLKVVQNVINYFKQKNSMKPTIGRIVIYNTTEADQKMMRDKAAIGKANVQEQLPAIIVAVWNDITVNLKVELDGVGSMWKISSLQGDEQGKWNWPILQSAVKVTESVASEVPTIEQKEQLQEDTQSTTIEEEPKVTEKEVTEEVPIRRKHKTSDLKTN